MSTDVQPTARGSLSERVGMEIKVARVRAGISGRELARRLGASQTWVSTRENGVTPLDLDDLQRIADALGVPLIQLLPVSTRSAGRDSNVSSSELISSAISRPAPRTQPTTPTRTRQKIAAGSPMSPQRRDSTRPVSGIPVNWRRPVTVRSDSRPIPA